MKDGNPELKVGSRFNIGMCDVRIVAGKNGVGDKVFEMSLDNGISWWRVPIAFGLAFYEFKCEVEDNNYPYPQRGRYKLKDAYEATHKIGFRQVDAKIQDERARKKKRESVA